MLVGKESTTAGHFLLKPDGMEGNSDLPFASPPSFPSTVSDIHEFKTPYNRKWSLLSIVRYTLSVSSLTEFHHHITIIMNTTTWCQYKVQTFPGVTSASFHGSATLIKTPL